MTSEQLAKAIGHMINSLESRIIGEALEEIDDLLVYLSWARIRTQKVRANLKDLT